MNLKKTVFYTAYICMCLIFVSFGLLYNYNHNSEPSYILGLGGYTIVGGIGMLALLACSIIYEKYGFVEESTV